MVVPEGGLESNAELSRTLPKGLLCLAVASDGKNIYAGASDGWLYGLDLSDPARRALGADRDYRADFHYCDRSSGTTRRNRRRESVALFRQSRSDS